MDILKEAIKVFENEIKTLLYIKDNFDRKFVLLVNEIMNLKGKVIITGMGKAGLIGKKIVGTMNSLGFMSIFLHPSEALHGDLGIVSKDDFVIIFSKSGETEEVLDLIKPLRKFRVKISSITCRNNSTLSELTDINVVLPILSEASPYQLAPTTSTTAMLVFGDALAIVLSKLKNITPEKFALFHPNGSLGKKILFKVEALMKKDNDNSYVYKDGSVKDAIMEMSKKGLGAVAIVDKDLRLLGILTDGDLRRFLGKIKSIEELNLKVVDIMTKTPVFVYDDEKAIDVLRLMENREKPILVVPVVNRKNKLVGMLRLHDIIKAGIYNE
ncbi:arabinose-5-phosphate isomerase [Marinitoga hydrogenitolerans DSM 16785]|uniref:Arabinose-5-phosphate isomerase n=1 Tax=Marinitoga hydrogenitolerans (strain DSM 16785 / JCM 12826 / AT1271) TaxID=1122195 RepID=A0A1M4ZXY3_MARH1|nr:KpsF/GutQ family sugar-phosphate isomerase [Marinitoga hydrogenitolerans]SHF22542.1 arabinose-5-phosphate isomerase [Marinitoga hydrogenitolerans DSM 16785]